MRKIRVGVVGLGNLGRSCIDIVKERSDLFELIAVFSRREVEGTVLLSTVDEYKDKIDILLVCVGSSTDAPILLPQLAKNFSTVDSFDTHAKIGEYIENIQKDQGDVVAVVGTGWDPGIMSLMRIYFDAFVIGKPAESFWGDGVSLGHSNAVREIEGVEDAIQFTIPKEDAVDAVRKGKVVKALDKHKRVCFVVAQNDKHKQIEEAIKTMPNYFAGYETEVNFTSKQHFDKEFKGRVEHGGLVLASDGKSQMEFKLKLESNPYYTASVMVAYAIAAFRLKQEGKTGVFTVADIAPKYLEIGDVISKI
ncbi:MAG: diaminopimelate dehydrogenase [Firmicutes bacterium]|nr:diaminopimelate dehydrogenase [Bacillota bacterium]